MDPPQKRSGTINYGMSLTNQLNMTNCYKHCKHFFDSEDRSKGIHFNVLIAYWMMAGYLGPFDSIQEAYERGHKILLDLTCGENSMLKNSDQEPEMIEFKTSADSESLVCSGHKGLCDMETLGFGDLVDLAGLGDFVVPADGMLKSVPRVTEESLVSGEATMKQPKQSMLLIHGRNLSRQVFHTPRKLRYVAYFNPMPESLNLLLNNVTKQLSVLLLRDCDMLREIDIPLEKFSKLTVLEISGLSQVHNTGSLLQKISELSQLRCLHLSDLLVEELPEKFFDKLVELRWIILRGCSRLGILPSVRNLPYLKMLDVSNCSALVKSSTAILLNPNLEVLDFSYTPMKTLPTPQKSQNLTHMIARDAKVSVLACLKKVRSLQVLDLSGAKMVKKITQLIDNKNLTVLNLSSAEIETIDFLPDLIHLHDLVLHQCAVLKELPSVGNLTKLEVFDISGCKLLKKLPEGLRELESLKELNVSLTSVSHLPSFAKLTNLVKLSLGGLKVVSLEGLESLSEVEELDLNSLQIIAPQELKLDFLVNLVKLQILNLSHTLVAQLPDISNLVSLKQLLLANCQLLEVVPDIQPLTNLETLDLSLPDPSTINNEETNNEVPSTRRKLVLKNRSGENWLLPLTSLGELGYLDLRGTDVDRIPYEKMAQMSCVLLPAKIGLSGVWLSRMGAPNEAIDWKDENPGHLQGKFSDASEIQIVSGNGNKSSMSTQGSQFFHLSEKENQDSNSWEAFIHQISVSLPPREEDSEGIIYLDGDDFVLRGDRSWATRLLNLDLKGRSIEIHGFSKLPDKIEKVLDLADNVALVGNTFQVRWKDENDVASVSNELPDSPFIICSNTMKVCCIRGCHEMESVLTTEEEKNGVIAGSLERLVLSNLVKLKMICAKSVSSKTIASLKHLHIDCCPELKNLIIASQMPENLESLHAKFCDKMNNLFEQNISLNYLQKLILFELPELESIEAKLPKLETLIIGQCPKLKSLDGVIESASASLTKLYLDCLPCLVHALPSSPELGKLGKLKISCCNGIVTLFASSASTSASKKYNLQTLKLHNLPKLESIGAELYLASAPDLDPRLPANVRQQIIFPALHKTET